MIAYLSVQTGPEKGRQFILDTSRPVHIGRGTSCEIVLTDPVSSRFHAVVYYEDHDWHLRDTSSRNGTLVNGQKTDHARLLDLSVITIGETDLQLQHHELKEPDNDDLGATLVQDVTKTDRSWHETQEDPIAQVARTGHVLDLYQLSLTLLNNDNAIEVIDIVLDLVRERTSASFVCLSFDPGDGQLKPLRALPSDAVDSISLSKRFVRRVIREGDALWVNKDSDEAILNEARNSSKDQWTDMICVPLQSGSDNIGVLHLYSNSVGFTEPQFDMAVSTGRLLAAGLSRALEHDSLRAERDHIAGRNAEVDELIGESPAMLKLKERISRIGKANGSVLIRGESGSGKELVARAVHRHSRRSNRPMLTVNCAAIPQNLIESQLFGHKKGSFTGADSDHTGWFQQAHTGTLFLDEIGELTLEGQAKLLRILEGHPFLPVGATDQILVDVRVIAATNRDLAEFVRDGKFREDLFYRLSVFELVVPPLRQRGTDVDVLVNHFLDHFRRQHGRTKLRLSDDAQKRLRDYAWPGNVRQLRNVIDSAVVMADDPEILAEDVGLRDAGISQMDTLRIDEWEKRLIKKALQQTSGSVPEAAKLLGVSRATAYRKLTEYEIDR